MKKRVQSWLRRAGWDIRWIPRALGRQPGARLELSLELVIARHYLEVDDFYFVQVGAFDGQCVDPIARMRAKLHLRGLMIEAAPAAYQQLKNNVSAPEIELLQVAVSDRETTAPFYTLAPHAPNAPTKAPLISSLSREALLGELGDSFDWSPWIEETIVPCTTLNQILEARSVKRLDLLQIDAEGYDARILRALDFGRWSPHIINFEHALLSPVESEACWQFLIDRGYQLHVSPPDTLAVLKRS